MSDSTRAAPPPYDRQDPNRLDTDVADGMAGTGARDAPPSHPPFVDRVAPTTGPVSSGPALAEPPYARQPMPPRVQPVRRPAPAPQRRQGDPYGWISAALVYSGAALLGASIYQGKRTSAAEAGHPPIGRFIESDGATFHYVDIGEGPPIVLLHGIGSTLDDWFVSGVLDRLLPHHRIIAIDRPGYGYSSRPGGNKWSPERQARAIARMLHRLGAHEATVVAHSFGVLPALALALQHPTFARSLVLIGGVYMPGSLLGRLSRAVPSVPLLGPLARGTVSPAIARAAIPSMVRTMFEPQPVTRTFRARFSIDFATRPGQLRAAASDLGAIDRATRRFLPHYGDLDIQVTVVTGSGDAIFDPDTQSRPFAAAVPNSSLVVIPAGGHLVHHTSPDLVSEVILDTAAGRIESSDLGPPPDIRAGLLDPNPTPEPEPAEESPEPEEEPDRERSAKAQRSRKAEPEPDTKARAEPEPEPQRKAQTSDRNGGADSGADEAPRPRSMASGAGRGKSEDEKASEPTETTAAPDKKQPSSSPVGPASSATAAAVADGQGSADAGDSANGDTGGSDDGGDTSEEESEPAPKRRRSRSRRKTD